MSIPDPLHKVRQACAKKARDIFMGMPYHQPKVYYPFGFNFDGMSIEVHIRLGQNRDGEPYIRLHIYQVKVDGTLTELIQAKV